MHHLFPSLTGSSGRLRRLAGVFLGGAVLVALGACSGFRDKLPSVPSVGSFITPYKIDIVQGNVVTREQAQALRPGMTRAQISDLLGTPLLTSVFHGNRWDYVFSFRRQGEALQQRKLTVFFKDEVLDRFDADELPSETEFVASLDQRKKPGKPPVLTATEEQLKAFDAQNATPQSGAPAPSASPATSYPPLETPGATK
ncbi:outer membrane protein assembly factor BamE [Hydrogenophaga sp. PAMC20947]|uniref:outer membrane protein assembly factor BamE n=1 Tax=Hydrogenophaga sp. PAMC20947 TaxID=2565558 RepID=UPI00109E01CF|nr:outer membrane protein assembly factor BamE [Hydrogenophaga sp. PAMC20947]QCB47984.1 outer membrane protein assembly factor BamE [Hydrogenophaga sp. PAMC20947]